MWTTFDGLGSDFTVSNSRSGCVSTFKSDEASGSRTGRTRKLTIFVSDYLQNVKNKITI